MIDVKQAVVIANRFLRDMYEEEDLVAVRLEEVELAEDGSVWNVTLSFLRQSTPIEAEIGVWAGRELKVITVHAESGHVRSMKIRIVRQGPAEE